MMSKHLVAQILLPKFPLSIAALLLLLGLSFSGCSRSAWIRTDVQGVAHEVAPREQLECAQRLQQDTKEWVLEQEIIEQRIEQCMLDKGYQRRPWWLLNDLHWHLKKPNF